ncbi:hypothetical protein IE81DRAFT_368073 [Ceraceosorus guamensis]|uniref:CST complex subunit Stn1 N-terminal domain-containing protein n=1 Tax=Ceraceosorus guamensis TaxID=1522189 RepID=A0A316VW88_9BASI|nr:hypothetical protein IE81DRAFT_368073 [Ceraceosorus guamensis]PWN40703.1 hypothetical protein IE81DRAFT_368073 [Ceraceosorus guamensis]
MALAGPSKAAPPSQLRDPLTLRALHSWSSSPLTATLCSCIEARDLLSNILCAREATPLCLHLGQRPTKFVNVVGMCVGCETREGWTRLWVDDGTAVLPLHHYHSLVIDAEAAAEQVNKEPDQIRTIHTKLDKDKGKKHAHDASTGDMHEEDPGMLRSAPKQDWTGVPPEYWPREPPKPPSGSKTAGNPDAAERERTGAAAASRAYVDVGHVIRVCGRVKRFPWGIGLEVGKRRWGNGGGGFVEIVVDPNAEARHVLATMAARETYRKPFVIPQEVSRNAERLSQAARRPHSIIRRSLAPFGEQALSHKTWGALARDLTPPPQWGARRHQVTYLEAAPPRFNPSRVQMSAKGKVREGNSILSPVRRSLRSSKNALDIREERRPRRSPQGGRRRSIDDMDDVDTARSMKEAGVGERSRPKLLCGNGSVLKPEKLISAMSTTSTSSRQGNRHLKHHSALPDSKINEGLFRLHVEMWITKRAASGSSRESPFTSCDLQQVAELRDLAFRLVRILLRRRLRNKYGKTSTDAARLDTECALSSEELENKVRRLFDWTITQMQEERSIVAIENRGPERVQQWKSAKH